MVLNHMGKCSNALVIRTIKIKTTQILFLTYQIGLNPKVLQHTFGRVVKKQALSVFLGNYISLCRNLLHLCWEEGFDMVVYWSLL